jgi:hypothetical protein
MDRTICTDFLVGRPSYLEGAARLFDFGGSLDTYNVSRTPQEADARALRSDFAIIGNDLQKIIGSQKTR